MQMKEVSGELIYRSLQLLLRGRRGGKISDAFRCDVVLRESVHEATSGLGGIG